MEHGIKKAGHELDSVCEKRKPIMQVSKWNLDLRDRIQ
jgi:hypothetical protein